MNEDRLVSVARYLIYASVLIILALAGCVMVLLRPSSSSAVSMASIIPGPSIRKSEFWVAPDTASIPNTSNGDLIRYGRELIAHTSVYLGPNGKIKSLTNGMNCQNCHLKAGKKVFGNNYAAVAATYPKFRARSGRIESVERRVNDCLERSLNGMRLDSASREMQAFVAYITWVGKDVEKGITPKGTGIWDLKPIERRADPVKGKKVFEHQCVRCHGANAEGLIASNKIEWKYPPLFGPHSYNSGAGLFRLSRLAGFIKANMPNGATFDQPILSDEDAWDVAAYVNSMPRPAMDISEDWPDISTKPFDHPFGPYADNFSEVDHKYGPFEKIKSLQKKR